MTAPHQAARDLPDEWTGRVLFVARVGLGNEKQLERPRARVRQSKVSLIEKLSALWKFLYVIISPMSPVVRT